MSKMELEQVKKEAAVLLRLAEVLDPFDRDAQLRILESACTMLREDQFAELFRKLRACPT